MNRMNRHEPNDGPRHIEVDSLEQLSSAPPLVQKAVLGFISSTDEEKEAALTTSTEILERLPNIGMDVSEALQCLMDAIMVRWPTNGNEPPPSIKIGVVGLLQLAKDVRTCAHNLHSAQSFEEGVEFLMPLIKYLPLTVSGYTWFIKRGVDIKIPPALLDHMNFIHGHREKMAKILGIRIREDKEFSGS